MIVNEKALVRGMKEAYRGSGYTVLVRENDTWVIYCGYWAAIIDGQSNVPNEVLSLIVLHMGFLPGGVCEHGNKKNGVSSGGAAAAPSGQPPERLGRSARYIAAPAAAGTRLLQRHASRRSSQR